MIDGAEASSGVRVAARQRDDHQLERLLSLLGGRLGARDAAAGARAPARPGIAPRSASARPFIAVSALVRLIGPRASVADVADGVLLAQQLDGGLLQQRRQPGLRLGVAARGEIGQPILDPARRPPERQLQR